MQALSPEASLRLCLWTRFVSDPWLHGPCISLFRFPLLFCSACGKTTGCAGSGAWLVGRGESRWAEPHRARPLWPRPSAPGSPAPPPPGPRPVPPTVPWPQSLHCGPMNGVAFCLVGIPPRPEPRPPQVRSQNPGQAGVGPGATSGLGSLRRRRWAPLWEFGVPLGSGRRDSSARLGPEGGRRAGAPTGPGLPGRGHPVGGGARSWAARQQGWEARAPFVRDFQAGRPPPFPLPEFSFSVGEAPAQLEPQGVGEGSWGGTSLASPLRLGLRCGLLGSGLGPQPCPALPSARSGLWVGPGAGCQGHYSALGCFAWVLSSASC